ncbi:MAG: hypothetical protein QXL19_10340 [Ignisphaera sp.]
MTTTRDVNILKMSLGGDMGVYVTVEVTVFVYVISSTNVNGVT